MKDQIMLLHDDVDINDDMSVDEEDEYVALRGPLGRLGPVARDNFTPQQKVIVNDMYKILISGVEVMKYGRSGGPKKRFLFCDGDMTKLFWRATTVAQNPRASLDSIDTASMSASGWNEKADSSVATKLGPTKKRFFDISKKDSDREIFIKEILQVCDDRKTDVMRRASAKITSDRRTCFISIIVSDRTLDFEIDEVISLSKLIVSSFRYP